MPVRWLQAHGEALTGLQAEESFAVAEAVSVGSGKLKKTDHDKVIRRWNAALGRSTILRLGKKTDLSLLESLGMKVRYEPR